MEEISIAEYANTIWDIMDSKEWKSFRGQVNFLVGKFINENGRRGDPVKYRKAIIEEIFKNKII